MEVYTQAFLRKYDHPLPSKPQHAPHKHCEITYAAKQQLVPDNETPPALYISRIQRVQGIVGVLLYYGRAVDNRLGPAQDVPYDIILWYLPKIIYLL